MGGIDGPRLPTTDPQWIDQRLMKNEELTPDEQRISKEQTDALTKTLDILNQPVKKGDTEAALARVEKLKEHFKTLSPDMKEYMYNVLKSDMGLAKKFEYKLSAFTTERLLKELNPDHQPSAQAVQRQKTEIQQEKTEKEAAKNMEGMIRRAFLLDEVPDAKTSKK
jgi:hypothetical protein